MNHDTTPASLYTFVTCNKYNIRDRLLNRIPPVMQPEKELMVNASEKRNISTDSVNTTTESSNINSASTFTITISKDEFSSMVMCKTYRRRDKGKPESTREHTILRAEIWQHSFNEKIWAATK